MPSDGAEDDSGVTHVDSDSALIQLLDWVEGRKNERQKEFTDASDVTVREQANGAYFDLSTVAGRLRDHIEDYAPECDRCGIRKDLKRDKRLESGFRWDCRHCDGGQT